MKGAVHITLSCDLLLVDFVADWSMFTNQPTSDEVYKKQITAWRYVDSP